MADLAWHKWKRVLRLTGLDWPEALELWQLARLQYPQKGCTEDQRAFMAWIEAAIEAGTIKPEYKDETRTVRENTGEYVPVSDLGWGSPEWRARDRGVVRRHSLTRYATKSYNVRTTLIPRTEFARWWSGQKVVASEHIAAWLGRVDHSTSPTAAASGAVPGPWRRGLKRVAWEVAKGLYEVDKAISGPALWDAIAADQRVQVKDSDTATIKNQVMSLVGGEVSAKAATIKKDWRKQLEQAMKS